MSLRRRKPDLADLGVLQGQLDDERDTTAALRAENAELRILVRRLGHNLDHYRQRSRALSEEVVRIRREAREAIAEVRRQLTEVSS